MHFPYRLSSFPRLISVFASLSFHTQFCDGKVEDGNLKLETNIRYAPRQRRSVDPVENLVPANYNINQLPPQVNGEITEMRFSVLIMGVRDIKEINEELSIEMNMYMNWRDTRFNSFEVQDPTTNFIVLKPKLLDEIWHPDIFFENLKKVTQPTIVSKPASLRIYNDSSLRYSSRIAVTVACDMMFHYYPSDIQRCNVDLKSYAYNDQQLRLFWHENGAKFGRSLILSNFYIALERPTSFSFTTTSGTFTGLRFTIVLKRKLSFHMIQTYLPSSLLVGVSWLSFLVPTDSVPGRMAICVTCLLTLIAMFASIRQLVPNVAYVKALDIWMLFCVVFVFLVLAEFTIVLKLLSIKRVFKACESSSIELKENAGVSFHTTSQNEKGQILLKSEQEIVYANLVSNIEKTAMIVIPNLFIIFNVFYWSWLLSSNNQKYHEG